MTSTSTPLVYTYPVSSLGAGASFGNEDVFLRTSRESDWNGLWHARDDTFYAGTVRVEPWISGAKLSPATTSFFPSRQTTRYEAADVVVDKATFVPVGDGLVLRAAYIVVSIENRATHGAACEVDVRVDLRWNATPVPQHSKAPPIYDTEKVIETRCEGARLVATTAPQRYTREPNLVCPPGRNPLGTDREVRIWSASVEPIEQRVVRPSRARMLYRALVEPGARVELAFVLVVTDEGLGAAERTLEGALDHRRALAVTERTLAERLSRASVFTPSARINRGIAWAKVSTFRVMHRYRAGLAFTNDPPQDILVVRDAAWFALGASWFARDFVEAMAEVIHGFGTHEGGKLTEFVRCSLDPPQKEDDGLEINDDTPLWIIALHHHHAVARDDEWLRRVYPRVRDSAEWILSRRSADGGLVTCRVSGTNVYGIASWRNIIYGYALTGAVTEINAECVAALRAAGELAQQSGDADSARRFSTEATALESAIADKLVSSETGLYALSRELDGTLRDEVTADLVFPLMFTEAPAELADRVAARLTGPDFWTEAGLRTVGANEPEHDPAYAWGLMGGIWPNLTAWTAFALRRARPELVARAMEEIYALAEPDRPIERGRVVPGAFPEWFDGETFESKGMAMSPWMPPTYVWLALEGLAGLEPRARGRARATLRPCLGRGWRWLGARRIALGATELAFFVLDSTVHVAGAELETDLAVERYDEDVTHRVRRTNAPFVLALRRGAEIVVCVASDLDEPIVAVVELDDGRVSTTPLAPRDAQRVVYPERGPAVR